MAAYPTQMVTPDSYANEPLKYPPRRSEFVWFSTAILHLLRCSVFKYLKSQALRLHLTDQYFSLDMAPETSRQKKTRSGF
jgi:hypothetical protein